MRLSDLIALAGGALIKQRLRTGLSLLGVAIGVAAVVLLTSLGEGARTYVGGQFAALGTNLLIVLPGRVETSGALPGLGGAPNDLTLDDARAIERHLPQAEIVLPLALGNETVSRAERRRQVTVIGTSSDYLEARRLEMAHGRFLPELEWERAVPVVVLGRDLASELFREENPLGGIVRVGDVRMRVIGVLAARGMQLGIDMDEVALVPVSSAMRLFNRSSLFRVLVQVGARSEMEHMREAVIALLTERHGEEDVTCISQDSVSGGLESILGVLTLVIAGIAAVSLSVAGIGIMNVMLVSVSERTPEVGLLRALGARRSQVRGLFVLEAVLLSAAGGALGLGLAWISYRLLRVWYPQFPGGTPAWAVAAALGMSLAVGALFGVLPASRASRLDPVLALQKR